MRLFLSYSHDNPAHAAAVLALAQRLRREGYDAWIDQFEPDPSMGWAAWMRDQIDRADRVLLVPTETYQRRFYGRERPDVGKGVRWEGLILTDRLYHSRPLQLRAVLVGDAHERWIPDVIGTHTFYRDADDLLRHLRGEAGATPAPLAELAVHPISAAAAATRSRQELEGFLRDRFTFPELDRHLVQLGLDDLRADLPNGHHVGRTTYITQFVDAMSRTGTLADRRWWDLLRKERERFTSDIDALQAVWG
jgi:hypothetical protein